MIFSKVSKELSENYIKEMFIKNGGFKMYDYKISENVTDEVSSKFETANKRKKANELLEKLNKSNSAFDFTSSSSGSQSNALPEQISLEKKLFEGMDEKQIYDKATNELAALKHLETQKINDEIQNKETKLLSDRESANQSAEVQKQNIESYFDNAKENASNNALKRGLARSSIVINQLDAFDRSQIDEFVKVDKELTGKIDAINFELNGLGGELEKALNDFNISYAVKLQDKINNLNTDLKEQESKVIEYNNQIALKEAEFNKSIDELKQKTEQQNWAKSQDMAELYGKYGSGVINKVVSDNAYNIAKDFFSGLKKSEVLEMLKDEDIKLALGSSYNAILKEFSE